MKRTALQRKTPLKPGRPLTRSKGLDRRPTLALITADGATVLAPRQWQQPRKPINPVSSKRQAQNRQRRVMLDGLYRGERPLCAVWVLLQPEWCTRWADDAHEPLTRARGGSIVDPENCRALCRACHDILTFRPDSQLGWAYDAGLLIHSWAPGTGGAA